MSPVSLRNPGEVSDAVGDQCRSLVEGNLNGDFRRADSSGEVERLVGSGGDLGSVEPLVEMPRVCQEWSYPNPGPGKQSLQRRMRPRLMKNLLGDTLSGSVIRP
jgi:hypothetical protein